MTIAAVLEAVEGRTDEICDGLDACSDSDLASPSELPGWSRLTIACHLRFGAGAFESMTEAVLADDTASYYPQGREVQRPGTLVPDPHESPADVVASLRRSSGQLQARWESLSDHDWARHVVEPSDNPDLGPLVLGDLPVFRLTEVEAHGTDLGLGLNPWSDTFVDVALPVRLAMLRSRRPDVEAGRHAWYFAVDDGAQVLVESTPDTVLVSHLENRPPGVDVVSINRRRLLALLLGRTTPVGAERSFAEVFPGP